jgi:hypothetical protein
VDKTSSKKITEDNRRPERRTQRKKASEEKNRTIKMDGHPTIKSGERKIKKEGARTNTRGRRESAKKPSWVCKTPTNNQPEPKISREKNFNLKKKQKGREK